MRAKTRREARLGKQAAQAGAAAWPKTRMKPEDKVSLCGGWSCCPTAIFDAETGAVTLRGDDGQLVKLEGPQLQSLIAELVRRALQKKG